MSKQIKIAIVLIILCAIGSAIFLLIKFHVKEEDSKDIKERESLCEMEDNQKDLPPLEIDDEKGLRKLNNEEFKSFKIYLDLTYMKYQASLDPNVSQNLNKVVKSMEKAKSTLEKIFLVKPYVTRWILRAEVLEKTGISKFNENFFKKEGEPTQNLEQIGYDLYIFPKYGNITSLGSWAINYRDKNNRPIIVKMTFSTKFDFKKNGSEKYLDIFFLHYFTHLLGFSGSYIKDYFPESPYLIQNDKFNIERHYITSKKVIETAKKYYNCNNILGIELDNKGLSNKGFSNHWEPRILLGDYMASFGIEYEEQAISEITLSLMEDSGWYKANYYTGGLMRFGKNKGCEFLNEKCINKETHKTKFLNEFFDDEHYENRIIPSCSSGRQSRNYKIFYKYSEIPQDFQYFEKKTRGGSSSLADYCPIMDSKRSEMENDYYVGNCKNGSNIYGYNTNYKNVKDNKYYYGINNTKLPKDFGESLNKNNSFCVINSLVLRNDISKYNYDFVTPRAMCHEMFCSEKSLTIKLNNEYIVCPRQGGKVEIEGYNGFILCPDYNLICTGTIMCNDLFECVEKKSLIKEAIYDYEINTSQDYEAEKKKTFIIAYEESSNGFCPKDCAICNNKKICLKMKNLCFQIDENCEKCIDKNTICTKCKNDLYLYNNKCYEKKTTLPYKNKERICSYFLNGCKTCITEKICIECDEGFGFDYVSQQCLLKKNFEKKYYLDKKDLTYKVCENKVPNCLYCSESGNCYRCKSGYFLIEVDNGVWDQSKCYTKNDLLYEKEYYNKNNTHRPLCSSKIPGCYSCNPTGTKCYNCLEGYQWYKKKNCVTPEQRNNLCSTRFHHCLTCNDSQCTKCQIGYTYQKEDRYGRCFPIPGNDYYNDTSTNIYRKCLNSPFLDNCLKCKNATYCIECDPKIHKLVNNKCIRITN